MTQLNTLRRKLALLRRARQSQRWVAAHSAWPIAVLAALAGLFLLDYAFALTVPQRLIVVGLALVAVVWAFIKYAAPLLGVDETEIDLALLVERRQQSASDLVAALQFEQHAGTDWGSPQLRQAVIDQVAERSGQVHVSDAAARTLAVRRATWLAVSLLVATAFVLLFPEHARVFGSRLLLGSVHYPTATRIERIAITGMPVLDLDSGSQPRDVRLAEGDPLTFLVRCTGRLPDRGEARLTSGPRNATRVLELERLPLDERRLWLEDAASRIREALDDPQLDTAGPWATQTAALLRFDAPETTALIEQAADDRTKQGDYLQQAEQSVAGLLLAWPGEAEHSALYRARLDRLVEPVRYQLFLGDAWTDLARVEVIPAPAIELQLTATPPAYAASAQAAASESGSRQLSALEGSRIDVSLRSANGKPLRRAWLTIKSDQPERFELQPRDDSDLDWQLDIVDTPFARLTRPVRFEVQVTDADGLHLPTPARGYIAIKPDRPPTGSAEVVHRVVLPSARPKIAYRVADDYGVASVRMRMQIEKAESPAASAVGSPGTAGRIDEAESPAASAVGSPVDIDPGPAPVDLLTDGPLLATQLPHRDTTAVDLSSLGLVKGDRLKLTLEVVDYRGDAPGQSYLAEPLVLEISDESGVLAAISEADERSEERMTDIIKQQLGIGATP